MKLFRRAKDGGPKSTVTGYWLIEAKKLFSIALLKFEDGSRDEFHNHAFNSYNWLLWGEVEEQFPDPFLNVVYRPSVFPIYTSKQRMHRVVSKGTTWVFTVRGPWEKYWKELDPYTGAVSVLTHGRKVVSKLFPKDKYYKFAR